ncbi:Ca2+-binding EF-hand superfamily protein [Virgibacillus natechei]|uniref:Ca2+-binding EF-hand superfamily protein n=1 Tax=Virgibacillus natechei TaxID=1216297 RepID=A0ABS4IJP9_9BACI|nr:hypothetical protein [Virgibacillus natechei]MBP1971144.1 Ca2+-binding EF-hand superfamily protein [Virgibacillus natechei]UZD12171.1 hypothetical protein OLD84_14720 [Virgibacillus natechei]
MKETQFQAQIKKKNFTLTAEQVVLYKQSKIIKAIDEQANDYYLFFYKDYFLTGAKADAVNITADTYVHRAFTNGIVYKGSHPLAQHLIRQQKNFPFLHVEPMIKKVQETFSPIETTLIHTFFDSFMSVDSIKQSLKDTFKRYQRNGQTFAAYQVLNVYLNYDPTDRFAMDMFNGPQFKQYKETYKDLEKLSKKDPIQFESLCFDNLYQDTETGILLELYMEQNRWMDELAIRINVLKHSFSQANFTSIQTMLQHLPSEEQMKLLQEINQSSNHPIVQEAFITNLLASGKPNDMVTFILTTDILPKEEQLATLITQLEQADYNHMASFFTTSNKRLLNLSNNNPQTLERLVFPFVSSFLQDYEFSEILDWFAPFHEAAFHLPVEQKLVKMQTLADDPDRQFELGELYIHFNQLEKSIDCFKWKVELNPQAFESVKYLAKINNELNYQEEAAAYQQLLIQMQKS